MMIKDNGMEKKRYKHHILILGGGASGIMAAIIAARMGADVAILEHTKRIGKKILATGNGKCNLTNSCQESWCYRGDDVEFSIANNAKFITMNGICIWHMGFAAKFNMAM